MISFGAHEQHKTRGNIACDPVKLSHPVRLPKDAILPIKISKIASESWKYLEIDKIP